MDNRFEAGAPSMDEIRAAGVKMLVAIVGRADGERAAMLFRRLGHPFLLRCMAKGTAKSGFLDIMGFGDIDKAVILCVMPGIRARAALDELAKELRLDKPGRGIAFSVPLSGVSVSAQVPVDAEHRERIQHRIEEGVDAMMDRIEHDLILAVVNEGHSEALVEHARDAGAPGATVMSARHAGTDDAVKMLGLSFQAEKEIVAILAARAQKQPVMNALNEYLAQTEKAHGLVFSLPVDNVTGLRED